MSEVKLLPLPEWDGDFMTESEFREQAQSYARANLAERDAEVEALRAEVSKYKVAWEEFSDRTEWVQKTAKPRELGMHRADVLRQRIERAEARAERLAEALREISLLTERECDELWDAVAIARAALNPTAAQENDDA